MKKLLLLSMLVVFPNIFSGTSGAEKVLQKIKESVGNFAKEVNDSYCLCGKCIFKKSENAEKNECFSSEERIRNLATLMNDQGIEVRVLTIEKILEKALVYVYSVVPLSFDVSKSLKVLLSDNVVYEIEPAGDCIYCRKAFRVTQDIARPQIHGEPLFFYATLPPYLSKIESEKIENAFKANPKDLCRFFFTEENGKVVAMSIKVEHDGVSRYFGYGCGMLIMQNCKTKSQK